MHKTFLFLIFGIFFTISCSCAHKEFDSVEYYQTVLPSVVAIQLDEKVILSNQTSSTSTTIQNAYSGTGFIFKKTKDYDLILTVHHMCESTSWKTPKNLTEDFPDDTTNKDFNRNVKVILHNKTIFETVMVGKSSFYDICILASKPTNKPALKIAEFSPMRGESVWIIGFPGSHLNFEKDTADFSSGYFIGTGKYGFSPVPINRFSLPVARGFSGAPIMNKNKEVVGILSRMAIGWHHGALSPGLNQIKEIIHLGNQTISDDESLLLFLLYSSNKP